MSPVVEPNPIPSRTSPTSRSWFGGIASAPFVSAVQSLMLVGVLLATSGCVQRRMLVRSQPEGAMVTIDRQAIGLTPVSVPFSYYGTREIQLEKDGYQTISVRQRFRPPWYEWFPLSFFSNHFALREIRDVRRLDFEMLPKVQVSEYQLIDRANQLRTDVGRGTVTTPVSK
ncbi:MAG: PEGA domain-containing protein [Planctomycetota bacterium]